MKKNNNNGGQTKTLDEQNSETWFNAHEWQRGIDICDERLRNEIFAKLNKTEATSGGREEELSG